jgi:formate dehydrogenase major subunit
VGISSRAGETVLRADVTERIQPGVVYTTFHFPESGANVITTDSPTGPPTARSTR